MWEYNHSDELYHYGVKGMKWGVRRKIRRNAIDYAKGHYERKKLEKKYDRLDKKIRKLKLKKSSVHNSINKLSQEMTKKASNLSEKDIAQGKREVIAGKIAKGIMKVGLAAFASEFAALNMPAGVLTSHTTISTGLNLGSDVARTTVIIRDAFEHLH